MMSGVQEVTGENSKTTCLAEDGAHTRHDHVEAERSVNHVVAGGSTSNTLQLPSPVYFALFIDDTHVILGAGGGGHRFGMANVLALIEVNTRVPPSSHNVLNKEITSKTGKANTTATINASCTKEHQVHSLWTYCCALDLESDVPWCTSSFISLENTTMTTGATPESHVMEEITTSLPGKAQTEKESNENHVDASTLKEEDQGNNSVERIITNNTTKALIGYFAVSSISCFLLIGVYKSKLQLQTTSISARDSKPSFNMSVLTRVALPNDKRNPDKKPISIIHDAFVTVAHDENGVYMYNFRSLIQKEQKKTLQNLEEELFEKSNSKHSGDATIITTTATDNITIVDDNNNSNCKKNKNGVVDDELTCTRKYVPFANWMVETRLNDLHTNRFYSVKTKLVENTHTRFEANGHSISDINESNDAASEEPHASKRVMCKTLVRHYCLIAALGQDKTIKLTALRLPITELEWKEIELISQESQSESESESSSYLQTRHVISLQTIATLSSVNYNLPFTPLTSSLRIIRLFGLENFDKKNCEETHTQCNNEPLSEVDAKRELTLTTLQYKQHIHEQQRWKQTKYAKETSLEKEQHKSAKECVMTNSNSNINNNNNNNNNNNDAVIDVSVNATEVDDKVIISSLVVVAFDARQNKSYMLTGQVLMSLEDATHEPTNGEVQSAQKNCSDRTNICANNSSGKLQQVLPSLSVQMSSCSSFIINDCITCITPVANDHFMKYHEIEDNSKEESNKNNKNHYYSEHDACGSGSRNSNNKLIRNSNVLCKKTSPPPPQITQSNFSEFFDKHAALAKCTGTCLPRCWLAGTVDGTVALIELHKEADYHTSINTQHFALRATRPVSGINAKRMASYFPALHSEPISGIALSSLNDVVTIDIAQHVVLTTLPLIEQRQQQKYKEKCKKQQQEQQEELWRGRSRDAVPLFPSCVFEHNADSSNSNNTNGMLSNCYTTARNLFGLPKTFILFMISICAIIIAVSMH